MSRRLLRCLAWLLITMLFGCSGSTPLLPWQRQSRLIIVWLDRSASAESLRPQFRRWTSTLLSDTTLQAGDRVVVAPIDGASYGLTDAADVTLPRLRPLGETTEEHAAAMNAARAHIRRAVDSILVMPAAGATAIIDALAVSARIVDADRGREAAIIVMSDGVEDRPGFRLTNRSATSTEGRRLGQQVVTGAGTDAGGFSAVACVSMVGLGALPGIAPARLDAFWRAVVAESGAQVGQIGPTLLSGLGPCGPRPRHGGRRRANQ